MTGFLVLICLAEAGQHSTQRSTAMRGGTTFEMGMFMNCFLSLIEKFTFREASNP